KPKAVIVLQKRIAPDMDVELASLCKMMRLMSERDTDGTLPQVLKIMMVEGKGKPVGGSDLSRISGINRITIIHHLGRLEDAGLVRRSEGKYILKIQSAEDMLMEFRKEMERHFTQMDEMARQIDEQFENFEKDFEQQIERQRKRNLK
ncbi:MAG: helix-turn-helix domain-containing protein, partial [Candidatus Micrarchaeota archaeon]|nr:helix-turn-helix domain-containing protein [Candidatus Micrarchaeota archaeon]